MEGKAWQVPRRAAWGGKRPEGNSVWMPSTDGLVCSQVPKPSWVSTEPRSFACSAEKLRAPGVCVYWH